jgi:hypothetical protein
MQPRALLTTMRNSTRGRTRERAVLRTGRRRRGVASFGFSRTEALITGLAMMFSSTIISIKLLPTTVLHHRHTGELMVGLLLLQDMIAIFVLVALLGSRQRRLRDRCAADGTARIAGCWWSLAVVSGAARPDAADPAFRPLSRIHLPARDRLVPRARRTGGSDEAVAGDRGLRGRRVDRLEPDQPVHRDQPEAAARLLPDPVLLLAGRQLRPWRARPDLGRRACVLSAADAGG